MKKKHILTAIRTKFCRAIRATRARSAWAQGVRCYAVWLLCEYLVNAVEPRYHEWLQKNDDSEFTAPEMTEKLLLDGAKDWKQYSKGGKAYVSNFSICKTLATPSVQSRKKDGELPPNSRESWLDVQARALAQAAELLLAINAKAGVDNAD